MADKTIYIIFSVISALMWIAAIDWIKRANKNYVNFLEAIMKDLHHVSDVITVETSEFRPYLPCGQWWLEITD